MQKKHSVKLSSERQSAARAKSRKAAQEVSGMGILGEQHTRKHTSVTTGKKRRQ